MKVCYFGAYDPGYSRNRVLIRGLIENGIEVVECNDRTKFILARYPLLLLKFLKFAKSTNIIIVGFPGQFDVLLAWLLAKVLGLRLFFDAFYSRYCSYVFDRKYFPSASVRGRLWWLVDWLSCFLPDKVILDTNTHINYFCRIFKFKKSKFARVFVGTDTSVMRIEKSQKREGLVVGFHGSYLPLQGVPVIIEAARLLKRSGIRFRLLGDGIDYPKCQKLVSTLKLKNVEFLGKVPYEKLPHFINSCDIYLGGPFGGNIKSGLVIPNKVYEALACGRPTIVGGSKATRELLTGGKNCVFVTRNRPKALAQEILRLKRYRLLAAKIGRGGLELARRRFKPSQVVKELICLKEFS